MDGLYRQVPLSKVCIYEQLNSKDILGAFDMVRGHFVVNTFTLRVRTMGGKGKSTYKIKNGWIS